MAKKNKIRNVTPSGEKRDLSGAYERAVTEGRERRFLKNHPKYRRETNASRPERTGYKNLSNENAPIGKVQQAAEASNLRQGKAQANLGNVGSYGNAFGSATGGFNPETGRYEMQQTESGSQQQIREGGEALRIQAQQKAQEALGGYQQFSGPQTQIGQYQGGQGAVGAGNALIQGYEKFGWQGSPEERQRIEEDVYKRLTRNVDRDQAQEFDAMEQRMHDRGIPLDPSNPAYKREADALNEKYGAIKEGARGQAVEMGGNEMQRSYGQALGSHQQGMQDTGAFSNIGQGAYGQNLAAQGQQFGQGLATNQQQLAGMAALQQFGMGYQGAPQLGYNAPQMQQTDAAGLWTTARGQNKQEALGYAQLAQQGAGGGEEEMSPFG